MPLCSTCSSAITRLQPQKWGPESSVSNVQAILPKLKSGIPIDCWICNDFSRWLEAENLNLFRIWQARAVRVNFELNMVMRAKSSRSIPSFELGLSLVIQDPMGDHDSFFLNIIVVPSDDINITPFVLPKRWTSLTTAKKWLDKCKSDHMHCRNYTDSWYPTRLLHFRQTGETVRLIHSKHHCPKGPYITLSHRWGPHMKLKLTSASMSQLQRGIPISDASYLFRDTLEVCQQLHVYYLWIDALCIKQDEDDLSDWINESENMSKVYSSAVMNISATFSVGQGESLFRARSVSINLPCKIKLDFNGTMCDYYALSDSMWSGEVDDAPLNKRGWVFQERFSARRVLHFGHRQLAWECRELGATEMFPDGLPRMATAGQICKPYDYQSIMDLAQRPFNGLDTNFAGDWHGLVHKYSRCEHTLARDKLVAFESVAKSFVECTGGRCIAGIWEKNIPYDLVWKSDKDDDTLPLSETSFRAPSWSWASVDGLVHFPPFHGGVRHHFLSDWEILDANSSENPVLSKHPSIRVRGVVVTLAIKWSQGEMAGFSAAGLHFSSADPFDCIFPDGSEIQLKELVRKSRTFLLPSFVTGYYITGLILAKIRGIHVYQRVGAIEIPLRKGIKTGNIPPEHTEHVSSIGIRGENSDGGNPKDWPEQDWDRQAIELLIRLARLKHSQIFIG